MASSALHFDFILCNKFVKLRIKVRLLILIIIESSDSHLDKPCETLSIKSRVFGNLMVFFNFILLPFSEYCNYNKLIE